MGSADAKHSILIAVYPSEYKNSIVQGLVDRYKEKSKIMVVPIEKLNSVDYKKYDAVVVIDALMAWQMFNARATWFIGKVKEPEEQKKIVLFFTAGDPKENYKVRGVDCITGASPPQADPAAINKISERIDRILK
jgi:menaquinone-dependent protoporphyrinogen IX oxidase